MILKRNLKVNKCFCPNSLWYTPSFHLIRHLHDAGRFDRSEQKNRCGYHAARKETLHGGLQGEFEIGKKFRSLSASLNSGTESKIIAQVCVGQKQNADYTHRSALITCCRFSVTLGLRRSSISRPSATSRLNSVVTTRSRS